MNAVLAAVPAPVVGAALASFVRSRAVRRPLRVAFGAAAVVLALATLPQLDRLSAIFVVLISAIAFLALLFSTSIFPKIELPDAHWASRPAYFILLGAFWSSMLYTVTAPSFVGLWIGISATTLATTFLVGFSGGKTALEAAWKYLILCSFGIAIALLGILLLGRAAMDAGIPPEQALTWRAIVPFAAHFNVPLFKAAVALIALGFATKAGLVPMHAWLPDAHSKAPAAISALLSGLLVSCALYAIVRTQSIALGPAGELLDRMLLVLGSVSVIVATLLMLAQRDVKRFLSYSTVEHSGLIAVALGVHTPLATLAALYHTINHAWAKSSAFLAIGVVQYARRGRSFFLAALVALAGLPPFGLFFSELLVAIAVVRAHEWSVLPVVLLALLLGFAALARLAIETEPGDRDEGTPRAPRMALTAVGAAVVATILCSFLPFVGWATP